MKILVIFLTLLSTSFGTYPGFVPAPVNVQPASIKTHSFAAEVLHDVPVAVPSVAVHAPKSIHAVEDVIPHSVVNPATIAVHGPRSIHSVVGPGSVSVPLATVPVNSHIVEPFSHATQVLHEAPVHIGAAPKSIHAVNTVAAIPAAVPNVDIGVPKSIHAPLSSVQTVPVVKSFSYATEIQHDTPIVAVAPVSIAAPKSIHAVNHLSAAPKSIHAARHFSGAPVVPPVVDIRVPTSIHAPVDIPIGKTFSYATEIQHDAPISVPVSVQAAPKSIHAVRPISITSAAAPIVNIRVPTSIHAPINVHGLNQFAYGSKSHYSDPVPIPIAPKSIHALNAPSAIAPIIDQVSPKSIHATAAISAPSVIQSFSHGSGIQHAVPVVGSPVSSAFVPEPHHSAQLTHVDPKSIHRFASQSIAPVVDIAAPAPLLKSFSYGTEVQHNAAVNIAPPVVPVAAAPKSIHHSAISSAPIHPVKAIHAANIGAHHPISSVVQPVRPILAENPYSSGFSRRRLPISTPINYSPAPVIVTSPVALHSPLAKLTNNFAYGPIVGNGYNIHLNRDMGLYARIAAPGAHLWNGNTINNGVGYVAGITGPLAYRPVPVYYQNYAKPTNAIYHYLRGK